MPVPPTRSGSVLRRMWRGTKALTRGPIDAAAPSEIARGASLIRSLLELLQRSPHSEGRFRVDDAGNIDVAATAFSHGITPAKLEERMRVRRRETKRSAYALFGLGVLTFIGWSLEALDMQMSAARILSAIEFLPFCLWFFLLAFKSAWSNYQLRTGRLDTALAYLRTDESFLPS